MGWHLRGSLERTAITFMILRYLIFTVVLLAFGIGLDAQVQLEKPSPTESVPARPPSPAPAPAPVTPIPTPPAEPASQSPFGLLILGVILAHVCLPISLILCLVVLLIGFRLFRGGLTKVLMGIAAAGGAK